MIQIKKIEKFCLDADGNKIHSGAIEYHYDEQQLLTHKKIYDDSVPKITTVIYDKDGNKIVRKIDTMLEEGGFSLSWNISTYDENGKLVKDEGCLDEEDEKYENLYLYDDNGDLSEEVWTKGDYIVRIKYTRNGELYEGVSEGGVHQFKIIKNKKLKNVLTETHDKEGVLLQRDLYEDFDADGNPGKLTKLRADTGTTVTEHYRRDADGNLLEKNVYISIDEIKDMLLSTEIREIEYWD